MAGGSDNRTERPTPRKLQKAREKGQVARSKEVPSAAVLLGSVLALFYMGPRLIGSLTDEMRELLLARVPVEISVSYLTGLMRQIALHLSMTAGIVMLVALVSSLAANVVQSGLTVSWEPLGFNFGKISPKNGLSRVFSKNGVVELLKGVSIVLVVSYLSYQVVAKHLPLYPRLVLMDVRQLLYWTASISYQVFLRVGIFLFLLALADYSFQRYRFLEQLKMTKQEVKDEFKEMEGDPLTRSRIRRIQREMARKRMMVEVPKADVVITNPTHYAVALSYKVELMEAPKVVAKGVGFLALKIKELAQEHDVPLVENRTLAQTLYKSVEIGEYIPASLYKAVAEILAYIYKARNAWKR